MVQLVVLCHSWWPKVQPPGKKKLLTVTELNRWKCMNDLWILYCLLRCLSALSGHGTAGGSFQYRPKGGGKGGHWFGLLHKYLYIIRTAVVLPELFCSTSFKPNAVGFGSVFLPSQTTCAVAVKGKMKCWRLCPRSTKAFLQGDRWYIFSLGCFHR